MKTAYLIASLLLASSIPGSHQEVVDRQIRFNSSSPNTFKIVQFTDIHFGEGDDKDKQAHDLMAMILDVEDPDMVIVTGDAVSGYAWDGKTPNFFADTYYNFTRAMVEKGKYWAFTAGNHDSQADLTREQVSEVDRSYNLSLTLPNAANISHSFNYMLPVYDAQGEEIVLRMWFLDTGDSGCLNTVGYDCVRNDQIDWLRQANSEISSDDETKGRGFLFMHIPNYEFINLFNNHEYYGKKGEDVCCWSINTGLFAALKEQPICEWVAVGHDHNNDYYGVYDDIYLAYGRKTGYGSYLSGLQHGARVFEVTQNPYSIKTWVRQEDGSKKEETKESKKPFYKFAQTICCDETDKADNIAESDEELQFLRQYYLRRADLVHLLPEKYQFLSN